MREIKFRGRISQGLRNAGTWVYWGLSGTDTLDAIAGDTIGQYTGLKDKNGVEIYESDLLVFPDAPRSEVWEVRYSEVCPEYELVEPVSGAITNCFLDGMEVIGNIHENPELVK